MEITTSIFNGDCKDQLTKISDNTVDLIITSPPYADQRKKTYGGVHPDNYVEWFLPISKELLLITSFHIYVFAMISLLYLSIYNE